MQRQPDVRLLGDRDHGLQEVRDAGPHLIQRVGSFLRQGRQVLHPLVVEAGPPGARTPRFLEVAFHRPVRVPVVLDHRQADVPCGLDRLNDLLDVGVFLGPAVDGVWKPGDHQVRDCEAVRLVAVHHLFEPRLLPGNLAAAREDVLDPELADAARRRRDRLVCRDTWGRGPTQARFQADLRGVFALEPGAALSRRS